MTNYSFKTLNDKEFEVLTCDLLSAELGIEFQTFKSGRDKGIDGRYSTNDNDNEIIVQAKHYANSGYAQLKSKLKNNELPKIKEQLDPKRYIVTTSLDLSVKQTEEIRDILSPYVKNLNDIYGKSKINELLAKYPAIEKNHFKLWFSSTSVLTNLLNSSSHLKNAFTEKELLQKISYYVKTPSHNQAAKILKTQKVLLITGAPGVGKTTLAQMIILDYIKEGYEHLVIEDSIKEAEDLLSPDGEKKQIVYYDDFLGANVYEILNPRNSENTLVQFIKRIRQTPNKLLVLTTRTTILNQALSAFEKLRYHKLHENSRFEIYLNEYSLFNKAQILYNHIYFGELGEEYRKQIFKEKNYLKIIRHPNYNPRMIEFFTDENHFNAVSPENYLKFILSNLDNPNEIWLTSYEEQINDEEKFLLSCLFTLKDQTPLHTLAKTYEARLQSEVRNSGYQIRYNSFNKALENLEGAYLKTSNSGKNGVINVSFINPSISDFLTNHLKESQQEKKRLVQGMVLFEQFVNVFHPNEKGYLNYKGDESKDYYRIFIKNEQKFRDSSDFKDFDVMFLNILLQLFPENTDKDVKNRLFQNINFSNIENATIEDYLFALKNAKRELVIKDWDFMITSLYQYANHELHFIRIRDLFNIHSQNFSNFIEKEENEEVVREALIQFLSETIEDIIIDNLDEYDFEQKIEYRQVGFGPLDYTEEVGGYELKEDIEAIIEGVFEACFETLDPLIESLNIESSHLCFDENDLVARMETLYMEHQISSAENYYDDRPRDNSNSSSGFVSTSPIDRINDLFSD